MKSAQVVRVPGESPDGQDLVEVHTNNEHQSCGLLRSFMSECTISVGKGSSYSILDPSCGWVESTRKVDKIICCRVEVRRQEAQARSSNGKAQIGFQRVNESR